MFASKSPRDLNNDPKPWRTQYGTRYPEGGWSFGERIEFSRDPRPEFDYVQHNEPNPLLLDYRLDIAHTTWCLRDPRDWLTEVTEQWPGVVLPFTTEQIDHARNVLTRLVSLRAAPE